jgi:ubiquinone/menaquinone biosynthesis C-methylase UbiE
MSVDDSIAAHYSKGKLFETILAAAQEVAADPANLRQSDLAPVDEFHIGGLTATERFIPQLALQESMWVLDVGSGIGGTSRYVADRYGCRVAGVDLTPEFCQVAEDLAVEVGLKDEVEFHARSAVDMPFEDASFDAAFTLHVAMNIADKPALYSEVARVLKSGACFGVYDVLAGPGTGDGFLFPVPWSSQPETSFLASIEEMRAMLAEAEFEIVSVADRRDFALEFFESLRKKASEGLPILGMHLLMGEDFAIKVGNMVENIKQGRCGPWELICRRK